MIDTLSADVAVAKGKVVRLAAADLAGVADRALNGPRKRARICAHPVAADPLHEMIICLASGTYIRPHRHKGKSESFHIIEGELDVVLFEDGGGVREVIRMGSYQSERVFFYRLMEDCFHTVLVNSRYALFHETTNGPFRPEGTEFAPWSPQEGDPHAARFLSQLRSQCA